MARKPKGGPVPALRVVADPPDFPDAQSEMDASQLSELARSFWAKSGNDQT